ncbi:hypothetical protein EJ08DRAFT_99462 [Tothia fuscella]|uniref:Xylanolytic transcriptional activator regulatory domain-containing protein n=1 Tax=Tothia fuscella TaxID=1048955 RepID=A0A9P4NE28_9PEZI|nr:hypothetical protein EJ08DRAFT_99462 [Tothia fuscella]
MIRHQQKDQEAGGEGLGDLQTRKKLWRDANGHVVTKRPHLKSDDRQARKRQPGLSDWEPQCQQQFESAQDYFNGYDTAFPSPPGTMLSTESFDRVSQASPQPSSNEVSHASGMDMFDFLANSAWGNSPSETLSLSQDAPVDSMFRPDTASSFNMPFTTMNNYDWLFSLPDEFNVASVPGEEISFHVTTNPQPGVPVMADTQSAISQYPQLDGFPRHESPRSNSRMSRQPAQANSSYSRQNTFQQHAPDLSLESESQATLTNHAIDHHSNSTTLPGQISGRNNSVLSGRRSRLNTPFQLGTSDAQRGSDQRSASIPQSSLSPVCAPTIHALKNTPVMCEDSRARILDLLEDAQSSMPAGVDISKGNPLLSLSSMQTCLDLFFSRFNDVYPLLHKPTFDPAQSETFLLLAVILLGATYGDKEMHKLAVCIHDNLRGQIFLHPSFTARPELWILQTIVLVECFGKSRAGQKQHDMAHLFHGLLINLIRRSNCQTVAQPHLEAKKHSLDSMWRKAIDVELRKRLAFLCFIWDTQHAVLFSQSLCMSSFELRTTLPCNDSTWEANTAEKWWECAKSEPQTPYLTVLRAYVNSDSGISSPSLNSFSRLLILHGLMSIQWDMKRRDQASLGFSGANQSKWYERIARCYDAWKEDFDNHSMNMMLSLNDNPSRRAEFIRFSTATIAIYHAAHIILNVEILDLQIYAGARHIIGRPVYGEDFNRSRRVLKDWAKPGGSTPAAKAVWHAAQLLRDGIMNLEDWDVNSAFHYPWCLYLATLTCWAFHFANMSDKSTTSVDRSALQAGPKIAEDDLLDDKSLWVAKAEMNALVSTLANAGPDMLWKMLDKRSTSGLTTIMGKHLGSIRWAVVHEARKVLRGVET